MSNSKKPYEDFDFESLRPPSLEGLEKELETVFVEIDIELSEIEVEYVKKLSKAEGLEIAQLVRILAREFNTFFRKITNDDFEISGESVDARKGEFSKISPLLARTTYEDFGVSLEQGERILIVSKIHNAVMKELKKHKK